MLKRLRDWWTRPTWEEYLAEHAGCLAVLVELDESKDKLQLNARINAALLLKYHDLLGTASIDATALPLALRKVDELEREVDRLRAIGFKECADSPVHSISVENGAIEVITQPPHWAVKSMAASFVETLDGAPNWRAVEIGPMQSTEGILVVTVCRKSGDSPVETVTKLKGVVAELIAATSFDDKAWHDPGRYADLTPVTRKNTELLNRALALINPEKKDA